VRVRRGVAFGLVLLLIAAACGDDDDGGGVAEVFELEPLPYLVDENALPFAALGDATASWGFTDQGSGFLTEVPANWNGDLVVWLHGGASICVPTTGVGCTLPIDRPGPELRAHLLAQGYAWTAPTYRDGRFAPNVTAVDTLDTVDEFWTEHPRRDGAQVFLVGQSFGGATALTAAELAPNTFAGTLAMCTGDPVPWLTALYDITFAALAIAAPEVQTAADYLAGIEHFPFDIDTYTISVLPQILAAFGPDFPYRSNAAGEAVREVARELSGGDRPLFDAGFDAGAKLLLQTTFVLQAVVDAGARSFIDNEGTQLTITGEAAPTAEQAAAIPRFGLDPSVITDAALSPDDATLVGGFHELSGALDHPVLLLSALGDMVTTFTTTQDFTRRIDAAGSSELLVNRAVRDPEHCGFVEAEMITAFDDLVAWADSGVRPDGDDVLDATVVAAPDYGCRFTAPGHNDPDYEELCR
jgi:pimeloyl-ACP methyl ester carboxylesterase